jgi:hypothetical protein
MRRSLLAGKQEKYPCLLGKGAGQADGILAKVKGKERYFHTPTIDRLSLAVMDNRELVHV